MAILVFAGVLSVPSAVFAEASWYGSLRAGVDSTGGNISVMDVGSRLGIKGSAEAGEGLTAVYKFEHGVNTADTAWGGGRLGYVGLSGGFGSVTIGQIWSASYNSFGAVVDNSTWHGGSGTSGRHGQLVSYAFSNDLMALQVDVVYGEDDPAQANPNDDLQRTEFGLSVNVGEIGKVALSHVDDKHFIVAGTRTSPITLVDDEASYRAKTTSLAAEVSVSNLTAYIGSQATAFDCTGVYANAGNANAGFTGDCQDANARAKAKTTYFGMRGGLGDTGVNYLFQWRDMKTANNKPWLLGLYKGLGDGASLNVEHSNVDGGDNSTTAWLQVNF